jgi:hypothetical protein
MGLDTQSENQRTDVALFLTLLVLRCERTGMQRGKCVRGAYGDGGDHRLAVSRPACGWWSPRGRRDARTLRRRLPEEATR